MKNKAIIIFVILMLAGVVYAASGLNVAKKEQCDEKTIEYEEDEPVYEKVTKFRTKYKQVQKHHDLNNTDYLVSEPDGQEAYEVDEIVSTKKVKKQKTVCPDSSYLEIKQDTKTVILDYLSKNFECRQAGVNDIRCDSRLDGNGDGRCSSGESCYFIQEGDDCLEISQINSLDKGATSNEFDVNGVCVKVYSDESFNSEWNLLGGDVI
ncbi:hypothetical protein ACFLYT_00750 [Nanoarchaeota archaeon]